MLPASTVIASSGGDKFEWAAIESVSQWRYVPVLVDGKPVATDNVAARVQFPPRETLRRPRARTPEALQEIPVDD